MTLTELAEKYHCDKWLNHSYMPTYEQLLKDKSVKKLLEIGIGYFNLMKLQVGEGNYVHGSSLKMWSEYWPEAQIDACDISEEACAGIKTERITAYLCDQRRPTDLLSLIGVTGGNYDVIIDDGSHVFEHQLITAMTLLPYLAYQGIYVIEDCYPDSGKILAQMTGGVLIAGDKRPDDNMVVIRR